MNYRHFTKFEVSTNTHILFDAKIDKSEECWVWNGGLNCNGYGIFHNNRRVWLAHRVAYFLFLNIDPKDFLVCHHCDNKPCVKPTHLFLGSHQDNHDDSVQKNRHSHGSTHRSVTCPESILRGESHGYAKLTDEQVMKIRTLYSTGLYSQSTIANAFSVHQVTIALIVKGRTWKHLPIIPFPARKGGGRIGVNSKLTFAQVDELRNLASDGLTPKELAQRFDITQGHISAIISGRARIPKAQSSLIGHGLELS